MKKKLISLALALEIALEMALTLLPPAAFAAGSDFGFIIENGIVMKYIGSGGDVAIPDGVTGIGDSAFCLHHNLTSVTIPDSVTSIGNSAFYGCDSLTSVTIPGSVSSIGDEAFLACNSLTSVAIPGSVTSIGKRAFYVCEGLTGIAVEAGNSNYTTEDGILFNKDKTELLCYPAGKSNSTYTIPDSVTSIGDGAFTSCSLTSVTIPSSVTRIGDDAFRNCRGLTSIAIPYGVTSIGDGAFSYSDSLTGVSIPSSVASIGKEAFEFIGIVVNIYYGGSGADWNGVLAGQSLHNVSIYCNCTSVDTTTAIPTVGGFYDVVDSEYYAGAVLWAVQDGITKGASETAFIPDRICTVGEVLTLLWRASGSPQPSDVAAAGVPETEQDAYYDTALRWAVETHIMGGPYTYEAGEKCTRSMLVDFLWKAKGSPAAGNSSFTDIPAGAHYAPAVSWAVENGITAGTGPSSFSPDMVCTRGQVVTFLYRAFAQ